MSKVGDRPKDGCGRSREDEIHWRPGDPVSLKVWALELSDPHGRMHWPLQLR